MRESCTYGSVRGVRGNSHPYRDVRLFAAVQKSVLAHSVALNPFCQGLLIGGEADSNAAAR